MTTTPTQASALSNNKVMAYSSDGGGQSSPTGSIQLSVASSFRNMDSHMEFQDQKRSFKKKMKQFFSMNKKQDKIVPEKKEQKIFNRRLFYINDRERNSLRPPMEPNYIRTTRYTFWSFVPLAIFYQFKRLPNFYFLLQAVLNSIPAISAMAPISAYLPLGFVLTVSIIRDGVEDYQRYRSDKETNQQLVRVVQDGQITTTQSKDLKVGDLVLAEEDEMFPADLVLMASSDPTASCYIQTSSLDGEKALKTRKIPKNLDIVVPSGGAKFQPDEFIFSGLCEIEAPHGNLYQFKGRFKISRKNYALDHEQMLLKGTFLRNTKWVVGLVVYTGKETRLMMNSQNSRVKQSDIESMMNKFTFYIVGGLLVMTLVVSILGAFWHASASDDTYSTELNDQQNESVHFYLDFDYSSIIEGFFTFLRYFQLLALFLPTSLFVSVEFLKIFIAWFINEDWKMMSLERGKGVTVKNLSIVEDLGMIQYIFTDKTGTLTRNQMEFHSMCVGQEVFGPTQSKAFDKHRFEGCLTDTIPLKPISLRLTSPSNDEVIEFESMSQILTEFMIAMSLAHECLAIEKKDEIVYQGQSPDEITLAEFAKSCGFQFITSTDTWAMIQSNWVAGEPFDSEPNKTSLIDDDVSKTIYSQINTLSDAEMDFDRKNTEMRHPKRFQNETEVIYSIEQRMDFTSDRKRMSILVRDPRDEKFKLYTKGADSEIKKRLKKDCQDPNIIAAIDNFVGQSSSQGLRTLLFAMKVLDEDEVQDFQVELEEIQTSLEHVEERVEELYSKLETGLTLLGATALEDRLQENVPDVINDFHKADIKVWMLTGDQFNTAENIGLSCRLIKPNFEVYRLKTREQVEDFCSESFIQRNEELMKNNKQRALIMEATALVYIIENPEYQINFIKISKTCEAVICCRVSPKQKADIVRMIKQDDESCITLAVGDGANDVSMINEAHVGIGIYGNEGLRAVQSSDFAIPEFQMLRRLILMHGRTRYLSVTAFILFFFYKNCVLTVPQFLYAYFCGFSATSVFDDFYINLYNTFFTALGPIGIGIWYWDIFPDVDEKILLPQHEQHDYEEGTKDQSQEKPNMNYLLAKLYKVGQLRKAFNTKNFLVMEAQGFFDAGVIFFIPFLTFQWEGGQIFNKSGKTADHWAASVTSFTALVFVIHVNLLIRCRYITSLQLIYITLGGSVTFLIYMWVGNYLDYSQTQFAVYEVHRSGNFYLSIAICMGLCFSIDFAWLVYTILIRQNPTDYLRILIANMQPLEGDKLEKFKELVAREDTSAQKNQNQQRKITDIRQQEFLKLRRESLDSKVKTNISTSIIRPQSATENKDQLGKQTKSFVNNIQVPRASMIQAVNSSQNSLIQQPDNNKSHSLQQTRILNEDDLSHQVKDNKGYLDSEEASSLSDEDIQQEKRKVTKQLSERQPRISNSQQKDRRNNVSSPHALSVDHSVGQKQHISHQSIFKRNDFGVISESAYEEEGQHKDFSEEGEQQNVESTINKNISIEQVQEELEVSGSDNLSIAQVTEQLDQLSMSNNQMVNIKSPKNKQSKNYKNLPFCTQKTISQSNSTVNLQDNVRLHTDENASPKKKFSLASNDVQPPKLSNAIIHRENNFIGESQETVVKESAELILVYSNTEVGNQTDTEQLKDKKVSDQ